MYHNKKSPMFKKVIWGEANLRHYYGECVQQKASATIRRKTIQTDSTARSIKKIQMLALSTTHLTV